MGKRIYAFVVERFNRTHCQEALDGHLFETARDMHALGDEWLLRKKGAHDAPARSRQAQLLQLPKTLKTLVMERVHNEAGASCELNGATPTRTVIMGVMKPIGDSTPSCT